MKYILLTVFLCTLQLQLLAQTNASKGATKTAIKPAPKVVTKKTSKVAAPKAANAAAKKTTNEVAKKSSKEVTSKTTKVASRKTTNIAKESESTTAEKTVHKIAAKSSAQLKGGIHWLSLEEAQEQMKVLPKKVYIDIFTDWCGWCKQMDAKVFTNKNVIDYLNTNYYAVHLNAETADSLLYKGKKYGRIEDSKTNSLAATFMNNKLTYPTSIFFDEDFANPQPVPGYLETPVMEMILKYIGTNKHKSVPFEKYKKEFKATWGD